MRLGNQGLPIDQLLDDVPGDVLLRMAVAARQSVVSHPEDSTCRCPAMDALAVLYDMGYRVTKEDT